MLFKTVKRLGSFRSIQESYASMEVDFLLLGAVVSSGKLSVPSSPKATES